MAQSEAKQDEAMEALDHEAEDAEAKKLAATKEVERALAGMKVGHAKTDFAEGDTVLTLRVGGNGETRG